VEEDRLSISGPTPPEAKLIFPLIEVEVNFSVTLIPHFQTRQIPPSSAFTGCGKTHA
jgi:hypothetical protein